MNGFETNNFRKYYNDNLTTQVLNVVFKNMNKSDLLIISKYYFILLQFICISFVIDYDTFITRLEDGNYILAKNILLLLFPFLVRRYNFYIPPFYFCTKQFSQKLMGMAKTFLRGNAACRLFS